MVKYNKRMIPMTTKQLISVAKSKTSQNSFTGMNFGWLHDCTLDINS